jgi:MarR family transcriptional regulator, organic hydroperoxide resistance regulator
MNNKHESDAGFLVGAVHRAAGRLFAGLLSARGVPDLGGAEGTILYLLWKNGPRTTTELALAAGYGKSTATSVLDRLERDGWISRVRDVADRRTIVVGPTKKAIDLHGAYDAVSKEMNERWFAGFTDVEIARLESDLKRVLANLGGNE